MQNGASKVKRVEVVVLFVRIGIHLRRNLELIFCAFRLWSILAKKKPDCSGKSKSGYVTYFPLFFMAGWFKIERLFKYGGIKP